VDLEAFELVVLRRPAQPAGYDQPTLDRLQAEHLAFYDELREAGTVATNGPVLDQPDESLRGFAFFRTGSLEETRRIAEGDPLVRAGRIVVDVMTWWCRPGTMRVAGTPVDVPDG
jgi:uncharacterized protein